MSQTSVEYFGADERPPQMSSGGAFFAVLFIIVANWSTFILDVVDFTRFSASQREHALGAALSLPWAMMIFGFGSIGVSLRRRSSRVQIAYQAG